MKPRRFASATTFSISWSRGTVKLAPYSPPGEPAARAGRPPHTVGRRMQARYSAPGEPAARAGRPPHMVGRRNANSILPTQRARFAGWPTSPHGGEAKKPIRVTLVEGLRGCFRPDP